MKNLVLLSKRNLYVFFYLFIINIVFFCSIFCYNYNLNIRNYLCAYQTSNVSYAKVSADCALYKTQSMNNNIANVYFYVPSTYFVSIISKINDIIYKVQYDNFVGYVSADKIDIVSFVPTTPIPTNVTFDIAQKSGTQIWSLPSDSEGTILTTISADTKGIEYIASATGEIPIGGTTNIWYYARFTPASSTTSVYEGYIYSEATTNLSHIANNLEYEPENTIPSQSKPISISNGAQIIMIVLICLPFLILLVLACIKIFQTIKTNIKIHKKDQPTSEHQINISPKQFIRKQPTNKSVEVVFPEYNYIDDDDLL